MEWNMSDVGIMSPDATFHIHFWRESTATTANWYFSALHCHVIHTKGEKAVHVGYRVLGCSGSTLTVDLFCTLLPGAPAPGGRRQPGKETNPL